MYVDENAEWLTKVYTDGSNIYRDLIAHHHEWVNHSAYEYVRGRAHINGIESFWATLKRGCRGTHHKMSVKHPDCNVTEFTGRHSPRDLNTGDQMDALAERMRGKRLTYESLIADNGLPNGARSG